MYRYARFLCLAGQSAPKLSSALSAPIKRISVPCFTNTVRSNIQPLRLYCTPPPSSVPPPEKQSLFKKFKKYVKDYWYVVIPVHAATSVVWFGGFYQAIRSGFDAKGVVEYLGFDNNVIIDKLIKSGAGDLALAYAMFKIATPARYTLTLGCSTLLIKFLTKRGYIRTAKEISKPAREMLSKKREKLFGNKPPPKE